MSANDLYAPFLRELEPQYQGWRPTKTGGSWRNYCGTRLVVFRVAGGYRFTVNRAGWPPRFSTRTYATEHEARCAVEEIAANTD